MSQYCISSSRLEWTDGLPAAASVDHRRAVRPGLAPTMNHLLIVLTVCAVIVAAGIYVLMKLATL
jgi:hypothetical protein